MPTETLAFTSREMRDKLVAQWRFENSKHIALSIGQVQDQTRDEKTGRLPSGHMVWIATREEPTPLTIAQEPAKVVEEAPTNEQRGEGTSESDIRPTS